jgi:alpha-glucosidase
MRLTTVHTVTPTENPLEFVGERGERLILSVVDQLRSLDGATLVRVRFYPEGKPRLDRTWMVSLNRWNVPLEGMNRDELAEKPIDGDKLSMERAENTVTLRIHKPYPLSVVVHLDDLRLEWLDADGQRFAADLRGRAYTYDRGGRAIYHYLKRRPDEHYYGFGETAGKLDKYGQRITLKPLDALGYNAETGDPLYKHFPFYITEIPDLNVSYGLFYDNLAITTFDMGKEIDAFWGDYRSYTAADGDLDYYLIFSPEPNAVLDNFMQLTGKQAHPPQWAFGYLGSTMKYTEAPDAQEQLKQFVDKCSEHDIPCSMFHLSSGYSTDEQGRRNVFTWNRARIPDPAAMVKYFHDAGIKVAANIKPHLLTTHPNFEEVKQIGGFIKDPDTGDPALTMMWAAGGGESAYGAYIDFTSSAGYHWWKSKIKEQLLAYGIDAVWNDNNEFGLWDDDAVCDGFGKPFRLGLGRPLQTLLMARASYEAIQEHRPGELPFVLTRSACPGVQRYAQSWSGDNETSWHTLQWNIPMGLSMSLSGFSNYGHDIGGFTGAAPDPELFVRWVQAGILMPRFAIHSWNADGTANEPWMYPDVLPLIRAAIKLRHRLIPYFDARFSTADQGVPVWAPVFWHTDDLEARGRDFEYMLGDDLLVAPVYEPGARTRRVYLPSGARWRELNTGIEYDGGQAVEVPAPLDYIPVFARQEKYALPEAASEFETRWQIHWRSEP